MISYEVAIALTDASRAEVYRDWLSATHIPEMLATGCFVGAELAQESATRLRARYIAADRTSLDRYLDEHAVRLRAKAQAMVGVIGKPSREVWNVVETWSG